MYLWFIQFYIILYFRRVISDSFFYKVIFVKVQNLGIDRIYVGWVWTISCECVVRWPPASYTPGIAQVRSAHFISKLKVNKDNLSK